MSNPVVHLKALDDAGNLRRFYTAAFGQNVQKDTPADADRMGEGCGSDGGFEADIPDPLDLGFYVEVPNLAATLEKIRGLGGRTVLRPVEMHAVVTIALFADPEDNVIGLIQSGGWLRR